MIRSTMRQTQPNCKVQIAKFIKNVFFNENICTYKKIIVLLHRISQITE